MSSWEVSTVSTKNSIEVAHDALASRGLELLSVEFHIGGGREDEIGQVFAGFFLAEIDVFETIHTTKHRFSLDLRLGDKEWGYFEGVRGSLVLNQCDLRGLVVGEIVHDHHASIGVSLHEGIVS